MSPEDISKLIREIPTLIIYLVPGYLMMWTMGFMLSRSLEQSNLVFKSIVLSYLIITLCNIIHINNTILVLAFAIILGLIISKILLSGWFARLLIFLGITRSVHNNFFNDIVDVDLGLLVIVYLKGEKVIYKGEIRKYEEKENAENSFILLSNYVKYGYSSNANSSDVEEDNNSVSKYEVKDNHEKENNFRVLLNTKDISRIELCYSPDSNKIL